MEPDDISFSIEDHNSTQIAMPQKKPITFNIPDNVKDPSIQNMLETVKKVAEERLFDWESVPLEMPPTVFSEIIDNSQSSNWSNTIFNAPEFDELNEVARDENGQLKMLNESQKLQLRERGEFDVDSILFPGEKHRWRINRFLQKGTQNTVEQFWKDISKAAKFLLIWLPNRLIGYRFSILQGIRQLLISFVMLLDLFFGLPHSNHGDMEAKLREERQHYLVCELGTKGKKMKKLESFWEQFEQLMLMPSCERGKVIEKLPDSRVKSPPYRFFSPMKLPIDLRLHNEKLSRKCFAIIQKLAASLQDEWFQAYVDERVLDLKKEGKSPSAIRQILYEEAPDKYFPQLFQLMRESSELAAIDPTIIEPLIDLARFNLLYENCYSQVYNQEWKKAHDEFVARCKRQHQILSLISTWLDRKTEEFDYEYFRKNQYRLHELLYERAMNEKLDQFAYFIQRDKDFLLSRKPLLESALLKKSYPDKEYKKSITFVLPSCWKYFRHEGNETFPTEMMIVPPEEGEEEAAEYRALTTEEKKALPFSFSYDNKKVWKCSTLWPFWRWRLFFIFTYVTMLKLMQGLLLSIPFGSPLSFSALFRVRSFYPRWLFNSHTGHIYRNRAKPCRTFIGRLHVLWSHVIRSRRNFESRPSSGLLDKSVVRHFHRLWTYVIQGFFGTILIILIMPPLCLFVSFISLILGLSTPIWFPPVSLIGHLLSVFIWDPYTRRKKKRCILRICPLLKILLWRIVIRGFVIIILCLLCIFVLLPLLTLLVTIAAFIRFIIRSSWDAFLYYAMLSRKARIPRHDDWVARRTSGPGMAVNYCYQAKVEQIMFVLLLNLEKIELNLWQQQLQYILGIPENNYRDFFKDNFRVFSLGLIENPPLETIMTRRQKKQNEIDNLTRKRYQIYNKSLFNRDLCRIKLSNNDLDTLFTQGQQLVSQFYQARIRQRLLQMQNTEKSWWSDRNLAVGNYGGLTSCILTKIFGDGFFISMEESDKVVQLQVDHIDLSAYVNMLESSKYRMDLDAVNPVMQTGSEADLAGVKYFRQFYVKVSPPEVKESYFSASSITILPSGSCGSSSCPTYSWNKIRCWPFKKRPGFPRKPWEYSFIIYHPAIICLILHKRDRESFNLQFTSCPWISSLLSKVIAKSIVPVGSRDSFEQQTEEGATPLIVETDLQAAPHGDYEEDDDDDDDEAITVSSTEDTDSRSSMTYERNKRIIHCESPGLNTPLLADDSLLVRVAVLDNNSEKIFMRDSTTSST